MISSRSRENPGVSLAFVRRGWIAAAVVGSVSLLGIGGAWARPPSSKASPRRASPVDEARAAAHERRLETTITARKEAYQKLGDPRLLFELGEIHLRSGRTVEAQRFYNAYLAHEPAAKDRRAAEGRLREIEVALALGAPPTRAPGPPLPATPWAVTPATTPPPLEVGARPPPPEEPPSKPREEPLGPAVPMPSPSASAQQPAPLPQPLLPQQPATSPPSSLSPSPVLPAPSTIVAAAAPASPTAGIDRAASLPVPRWVPVVGAALTGSLVVGALVGGTIANNTYDRLHATCAMTDAGCSPERIDGLRSLARVANALWIAAAVAGTGTAIVVFVDANAAGMSKTWSF